MRQTWPVLYKHDTTGKIRQWTIRTGVEKGVHYFEVEHGVEGGAMVSSRTEILTGKNLGKANETTPYTQASLEAEAEWMKKQKRKGYSTSMLQVRAFSPMLAKSYNKPGTDISILKDGKHIQFPCYYQPKLDGIRCTASHGGNTIGLWSRQNKAFTSLPHILQELAQLSSFKSTMYLDGELYVHGEEFQELVSAIKRDKPSADSHKVEYHIYDVFDSSKPDWPYEERMKWLEQNIPTSDVLKPVFTAELSSTEVQTTLEKEIKRGYEGIMLRNTKGVYKEGGRSKDLQKVKLFIDQEFPIVDAYENKGKMKGQCTFVCETKEGHTFGVKPEGDEKLRKQYWIDWQAGKIIDSVLTVRFFAWTTSKNSVPRFPVGVTLRNYE